MIEDYLKMKFFDIIYSELKLKEIEDELEQKGIKSKKNEKKCEYTFWSKIFFFIK